MIITYYLGIGYQHKLSEPFHVETYSNTVVPVITIFKQFLEEEMWRFYGLDAVYSSIDKITHIMEMVNESDLDELVVVINRLIKLFDSDESVIKFCQDKIEDVIIEYCETINIDDFDIDLNRYNYLIEYNGDFDYDISAAARVVEEKIRDTVTGEINAKLHQLSEKIKISFNFREYIDVSDAENKVEGFFFEPDIDDDDNYHEKSAIDYNEIDYIFDR